MKNLFFSLFAFLFLATATAMATPPVENMVREPFIVRSQMAEGGLEVILANLQQETTTITLTSLTTDRELFKDRIRKHNGYSYNINFDELHRGRYILAVKKGKTTRRQVILVNSKGVMCSEWK